MTTTYQPEWDIDLAFGEEGERFVADLLGSAASTFEVKTKRYLDFKFYVETHQRPRGAVDFKVSGIQTTCADYWAYVIHDSGVVMFVPTPLLKAAAKRAPKREERDGDNPTRGRLVDESHLFDKTATGEKQQ